MTEPPSRHFGYACLLDRVIRVLVMCDHSEQELRRKLAAPVMNKNSPEALDVTPERLEQVVAWCIEDRYLDDHRFIGQFIASRNRKGCSPVRTRQKLSQKGVARQGAEQATREYDIDWASLARGQMQHKYGKPLPSAFTKKVKVQRFLPYCGYLMEDIQGIQ